jgi:sulfur carrier protein ThiS
MKIIRAIFQLNKLHKLLKQQEQVEADINKLKTSLANSELVGLLSLIVKEHSASALAATSSVDTPSQSKEPVNASPAPTVIPNDKTDTICVVETDIAAPTEQYEELLDMLNDVEEEIAADNNASIASESFTDKVKSRILVEIVSFDEENKRVFLQSNERMFDFAYLPEDHVDVSVGDTRELIVYEDDTYLFDDPSLQEVKAA